MALSVSFFLYPFDNDLLVKQRNNCVTHFFSATTISNCLDSLNIFPTSAFETKKDL